MIYQNTVLRYLESTGILELGETVYCFVDEGHQFRVQTRRPVKGVFQVIFPDESRHKFEIVK